MSRREPDTAAALIPARPTLTELREIARGCRACPLWERGTQTVFGEGSPRARVLMVGEQPGNDEDLAGRPFVGPAAASPRGARWRARGRAGRSRASRVAG